MNYDNFIALLEGAGLSGRAFARLLHLHPNSISNYKKKGDLPSHLAVIAALIHTMNEAQIDYMSTIARVSLTKKQARGKSLGHTSPHKDKQSLS